MLPLMKYITVHSVRQMLHSAMLPARAHYLYTDARPSGTPSRLNIVKTAVGVHDKILKMCLDKGDHYIQYLIDNHVNIIVCHVCPFPCTKKAPSV